MSLKDIRLQDRAVQFLRSSIGQKRLPHSLLFSGPDSVGKRFTALTVAKTLNCEREHLSDSCDQCLSCKKIEGKNHPDINWIEPEGAGNIIKIERIRALKGKIVLKPFEGRVKFFIIDKAHLLTNEAANSILKTLEEPPADSVIVLITDDLNRVFPTLKSRCQWVLFSSVGPERLKRLLAEEHNLPEKEARFLSHLSEGRIGMALAMKDRGALDWKNEVLDKFSKDNIILNEEKLFFDSKRTNLISIMDILISWYRDIFILKNGGDLSLLINIDRMEELKLKAESLSKERIRDILKETVKMRAYIEEKVNPKLALTNLACAID